MHILFTKQFNKDLSKLQDDKLALRIEKIIEDATLAANLSEIQNLKKLKGFKNAYRIRLGDYRIGLLCENDTLVFSAFQHRKDIYRYFP